MNVTLPNGKIITNIPEGTTQAEIAARVPAEWLQPAAPVAAVKSADSSTADVPGILARVMSAAGDMFTPTADVMDDYKADAHTALPVSANDAKAAVADALQTGQYHQPEPNIADRVVDAVKAGGAGLAKAGRTAQKIGLSLSGAIAHSEDELGNPVMSDENINLLDKANTQDISQLSDADRKAYQAKYLAGKVAQSIGNMAPAVAVTMLPGVGQVLGPAMFGAQSSADAGFNAIDEGDSLGNAQLKAVGQGALNTALGHVVGGSGNALMEAVPVVGKAFTPTAADSAAAIGGRMLQGAGTMAAFKPAGTAIDYAADTATNEVKADPDAYQFAPNAEDLLTGALMVLPHATMEYAQRHQLPPEPTLFADGSTGLAHKNGTLFSSPEAAAEFAQVNKLQGSSVIPVSEKLFNPDAKSDKVLGYAVKPAAPITPVSADDAALAQTKDSLISSIASPAPSAETIAAQPTLDEAITAANALLDAPVATAPSPADELRAVRQPLPQAAAIPEAAADAVVKQSLTTEPPDPTDKQSLTVEQPASFETPYEQDYREKTQRALRNKEKYGMSEEDYQDMLPADNLDKATGYHTKEHEKPTIAAAANYADETGQEAHHIAIDFANLGGLNNHFNNQNHLADVPFFKSIDIAKQELEKVASRVVMLKPGGDEFSAVTIGGTTEQINNAISVAKRKIRAYAIENGLADIPRKPNQNPDGSYPAKETLPPFGIGIYAGVTRIRPGDSAGEVMDKSTLGVDAQKQQGRRGLADEETRGINQAARAVTPERPAGTAERSIEKAAAGIDYQGRGRASGMAEGTPGVAGEEPHSTGAASHTDGSKSSQDPSVTPAHQQTLPAYRAGVLEKYPTFTDSAADTREIQRQHLDAIESALEEGQPVKREILLGHPGIDAAEYPLAAKLAGQEVAAPAAAKKVLASGNLLQRIKQLGGIDLSAMRDITGENSQKNIRAKGLFRAGGSGLDDLATTLAAEGYPINLHDETDNGGVRQLAELVRRVAEGETILSHAAQEAAHAKQAELEHNERIRSEARELGIKIVMRKLAEVEAEVVAKREAIFRDREALVQQKLAALGMQLDTLYEEAQSVLGEHAVTDALVEAGRQMDAEQVSDSAEQIKINIAALERAIQQGKQHEQNQHTESGQTATSTAEGSHRTDGRENPAAADQGGENFALQTHTNAEVIRREAAAAKAAAESEKAAPEKSVSADQADMFNTQDSLFNSNREPVTENKQATTSFANIREFLNKYIFGKEVGAQVPNKIFEIGILPESNIKKIAQFIPEFSNKYASVRYSARALKHTDEGHHSTLDNVIDKLPEIIANPDAEIIHNPKRESSAFIIYREPQKNALVVIEIAKNGNGTDIVNIIPSRDRSLNQHIERNETWLESRPTPIQSAESEPAAGEISDVQPSDATIAPHTIEGKQADEVAKAKAALDAAGITGKDRTDTIAQVRQGNLTADDVAESHSANADKKTEPAPAPAPATLMAQAESITPHVPDTIIVKGQAEAPTEIADFGEKIGGARKDTAMPLGKRGTAMPKEEDQRPAWARKFHVMQVLASSIYNKANAGKWQIMQESGGMRGAVRPVSRNYYDTEQQALDAIPDTAVQLKHGVYSYDKDGGKLYGVFRRLMEGKKRALIKGGFETSAAAAEYLHANPEQILEHKFKFPERPWLDRLNRNGEIYRKGNVTTKMFQDDFGFRAGEFGNWNKGGDGQEALNFAYDALHDLAKTLNIPPKAISLDGQLAIAFGARGRGGEGAAAAHYEPGAAVINLTKIKGAGSLAHEWWHAVDHYFAKSSGYADSHSVIADKYSPSRSTARPELIAAIKHVVDTIHYAEKSSTTDADQVRAFAQKRIDSALSNMNYRLNDLRSSLLNNQYRNKKAIATAAQLKRWDSLVEKLRNGDGGEPVMVEASAQQKQWNKHAFGFQSSKNMVELNDLYKSITGRSFLKADADSAGRQMAWMVKEIADNKDKVNAQDDVTSSYKGRTDFYLEARSIDNYRTSNYWSIPEELGARAFESYIFDKLHASSQQSQYLVHSVENKFYAALEMKPYPEGEERKAIDAAFDQLFNTLKSAPTDKGMALFSADEGAPIAKNKQLSAAAVSEVVEKLIGQFAHQPPIMIGDSVGDVLGSAAADNGHVTSGMVYQGRIHLFRDGMADAAAVTRTVWHELLHYGLRRFLSKEQYISKMGDLYLRDAWVKHEADNWVNSEAGHSVLQKDGPLYARARGVDEALAKLAEGNAGEYVRNDIKAKAIRAVSQWIAKLADAFGFSAAANRWRAVSNEEALGLIRSVFGKLKQDDAATSDQWEFTADPSFRHAETAEDPGEEQAQTIRDRLAKFLQTPASLLKPVRDAVGTSVIPMSMGTDQAKVVATQFADRQRAARWQWNKFDDILQKRFTPEQQEKMWNAADEENDLRRDGIHDAGRGLGRLTAEERDTVELLHDYGNELLQRARDAGMYQGEGVDYWTPRMVALIAEDGSISTPQAPGMKDFGDEATNLRTQSKNLKGRKHATTAEAEAAAQGLAGEGETAKIIRNIRTMPMAMGKLEQAIAGRELVNQVKAIGQATGENTVAEGRAGDPDYFTINHPAMAIVKPRMVDAVVPDDEVARRNMTVRDGKVYQYTYDGTQEMRSYRVNHEGEVVQQVPMLDDEGNAVIERTPLYIRKDFEGPLKAVLNTQHSLTPVYNGLMELKSKSMGLIMMSPMIHNAVEYGRSLPMMMTGMGAKNAGKNALTLGVYTYFAGNRAKHDAATMQEALAHGLVPIGHRGIAVDLHGIADPDTLEVGKSWTAKALGAAVDLISEPAGDKMRAGVDKAGKFWHETLLWDRVADLQMGLYSLTKTSLVNKGVDDYTAATLAAHFANRYAGALPQEAMSQGAREVLNMALFSRTFTLGNLGAMKDMLKGLPSNRKAMIELNARELASALGKDADKAGADAVVHAASIGRRKAVATFLLDVSLMYVANSLVQDWMKRHNGDEDWQGQIAAYGDRLGKLKDKFMTDPLAVVSHPFNSLESLSATSGNAPGKEGRINMGDDSAGNTIYMRLPFGKIGEEFANYTTMGGSLNMLHNKLSPQLKPLVDTYFNDNGIGQKIYDDSKDATLFKQLGQFAGHYLQAQVPWDMGKAAFNLASGKGSEADRDMGERKLVGPLVGLTYSKVTGGDALSTAYQSMRDYHSRLVGVMPEVKDALASGDDDKARQLLGDIGAQPHEISKLLHDIEEPAGRLNHYLLKKFNKHATEDDRARMDSMRR